MMEHLETDRNEVKALSFETRTLNSLLAAASKFLGKCERGQARSRETYSDFKAILTFYQECGGQVEQVRPGEDVY